MPPTYCAQNILAEEKELLFLRVKPVEEAESLPRVSKHCLQRHCMRAAANSLNTCKGRSGRPPLSLPSYYPHSKLGHSLTVPSLSPSHSKQFNTFLTSAPAH